MGTKILNFQSFDLYKGKIIPQCSLELEHLKNILESIKVKTKGISTKIYLCLFLIRPAVYFELKSIPKVLTLILGIGITFTWFNIFN